MTLFLVQMAVALLLGIAVGWWQVRRADRSRAELADQGSTSVPARIEVGGARSRSGRLLLSGDRAEWTARRGSHRVDLTGAVLLSVAPATGWRARPDDVRVRLRLPSGGSASVLVDTSLADLLVDTLTLLPAGPPVGGASEEPPAGRRPGRRWWGWLLVAAGTLWTAYCVCMFVTGYSATVTVTGGDGDGFCDVVWQDPDGREQRGEADCADQPAGTPLDVRVTGWPEPGDPTMPGTYVLIAALFGGPPLALGTWRLLYLRRQRRDLLAWTAGACGPAGPPPVPLPPLSVEDLTPRPGEQPRTVLARLAPYAARQVPGNGWSDPSRPAGTRTTAPFVRVLSRTWVPVLLAVAVVLVTSPWPWRWIVLHTSETVAVTGTSTGRIAVDEAGPFPNELTVTFLLPDGTVQRADVATHAEPPDGETVRIVHAADDPHWARLVGDDDDLDQAALLSALATVLCLAVAGWRVRSLLGWRSRVRRATAAAPRPALGSLTADPTGAPLVLLTDPLVSPLRFTAVPLAHPLPVGTSARMAGGEVLSVHGELRDGAAVVVRVPGVGAPLLPAGPAAEVPAADLLVLLDAAHALDPFPDEPEQGEADDPERIDEPTR